VPAVDSSRIVKYTEFAERLMDTITAMHTRRSIRDYEQRTVEREIIADILWDAAQAPTTPVSGPFLFPRD
jgi:Nitroreductase family